MAAKISGLFLLPLLIFAAAGAMASAATISFKNQYSNQVCPAIISENGPTFGFCLAPGESFSLDVKAGWSGRIWARTGCNFDSSGNGKCFTGDCGSLNCSRGGQPPFTLAKFIIASEPTEDNFYEVSLVDGYNVKMHIDATGGTSDCMYAGCIADLNGMCLKELQVVNDSGSVVACKSACNSSMPQTCSHTQESEMIKKACPNASSYHDDHVSSRFACSGSNFLLTFGPTDG